MQKKIIALAVAGLMSGGVFAQSNVTISGLFDTGLRTATTEAATGVNTKTTQWGSSSNTATTNMTMAVTEDLGGGMKAGVTLVTEPVAGFANTIGFANSQNFLWVSGKFGEVKLGYFNNLGLEAAASMSPFGTALGGGYSGTFGRLQGAGDTTVAVAALPAAGGYAGTRLVRTNNAMQYKSPVFSGFQVGAMLHNGNSDVGVAAADATSQTQLGASYMNGPIAVRYVNSSFSSKSATSALGANASGKHNLLQGSYTFGAFDVMGGWTRSSLDQAGAKTADSRSWNLGLKYTTGAFAILANVLNDDDKLAGNRDRKLTGLGLDYSMSKRTTAYVRYESFDTDKSSTGGQSKTTAVGLRHSF